VPLFAGRWRAVHGVARGKRTEGIVNKYLAKLGISALAIASLILPLSVFAGTSLKINSASVDFETETLEVHGLGFPTDGSLSITIGDTFLEGCFISNNEITCSLTGTPALSGGTWNVRLSAGNSPNANAAIDVYILTGIASCNAGDYVNCYSGDASEVGVGECKAGTRTCSTNGTYGECVGEVTAVDEYPFYCRDFIDNDCDGVIDECRDVLVNNPTIFRQNATFKVPPGVSAINIAAAGGGGAGSSAYYQYPQTHGSGSGGGSGGIGVLEGYVVPDQDSSFTVHVGTGGTYSHGDLSYVKLDGGTILVSGGGGSGGGRIQGGAGGGGDRVAGVTGEPGELCEFGEPEVGTQGDNAPGGRGGAHVSYNGIDSGAGGKGEDVNCTRTCTLELTGIECTVSVYPRRDTGRGQKGSVIVWWDEPSP
jgi:hypothetical protein